MADMLGVPDAVDLGEVNADTLAEIHKLVKLAKLSGYTAILFDNGNFLVAHIIPTTAAITTALGQPTAGL